MELSDLAYCLFGTTKLEGEESDHPGGRGAMVGLLSVDTLNVEVVLRDGETLLASSGEVCIILIAVAHCHHRAASI